MNLDIKNVVTLTTREVQTKYWNSKVKSIKIWNKKFEILSSKNLELFAIPYKIICKLE